MKFGFNTPFAEQLSFFRQKLNLPTERWDDIEKAAHDRAFIVAGAMKADLLADLNTALTQAIEQGSGLEAFRKDFRRIVQKSGWHGWTGEGSTGGEAWRTKVIYQTNMTTSYAAGRFRQLTDPAFLELRPYWRYVHSDSVMYPRPHHQYWGRLRLTLRYDHPFWKTHFPPNGWGCHCYIVAVVRPQAGDATEAPEGWDERTSKGNLPGVDKGFDYAPGANADTLRKIVQDKLIAYPPAITKALSRDVMRYVNAHEDVAAYVQRVLVDKSRIEPLWLGFVSNFEAVGSTVGQEVKGFTVLLPDDAPRHVVRSHGHDGGKQRPPTADDYRRITDVLTDADRLAPGRDTPTGLKTIVAWKDFNGERFRCVFEVRPGKSNRSLALLSLVVKIVGGG